MRYSRQSEHVRFAMLAGLIAACFLMGGASRLDVSSLMVLQPLAAAAAAAFLLVPGVVDWRAVRTPLLLLAALAAIIAAQLIPLPPSIWTNLPGHGAFTMPAEAAGIAQPWRPISLTPDLTLASLIGLIVPLATLIGFASCNTRQRQSLLTVILAGIVVSCVMGLAQVSGGLSSPFYLYKITNGGSAVGLFANRNHQALLLAMTWPMLAVWAALPEHDRRRRLARRVIAAAFAVFLLPLLLITGSRAGLLLGLFGICFAAAIWWRRDRKDGSKDSWQSPLLLGFGAATVLVVVATIFLSRAKAIQRIFDVAASDDARIEAAPTILRMTREFLPVGSGFGSFDPLFRFYEPAQMLDPKYLNHAHNDLLELALTAGVPGLLLAAVFAAWVAVRSLRIWRGRREDGRLMLARLGTAMILLAVLSSLVDYPLRTPLMMALIAIACGWLAALDGLREGPVPASK